MRQQIRAPAGSRHDQAFVLAPGVADDQRREIAVQLLADDFQARRPFLRLRNGVVEMVDELAETLGTDQLGGAATAAEAVAASAAGLNPSRIAPSLITHAIDGGVYAENPIRA